MDGFFQRIFYHGPFMPHGHCYLWTPGLLWLHVISDARIVFSYFSIPITLIYFVRKRHDLRFGWMFVCFAVFIVACGTTHLMEIWNVWHGNYWTAGGVKAVTAMASVPTAFLLIWLVTPALRLPSLADLEKLNLALEQEVATCSQAEEKVRLFNAELEAKVQERTAQLHALNEDLRRQMDAREQLQAQNVQLLESERAAREEAERTSQMKDEFLATLSYELRTPLNAIYGWVQVLRSGSSNAEDTALGLSTIERNARAQKQIIDDLLDMSAIIAGKLRMDVQRVDLAPVVEAAVETVRPAADAKGIRLQTVLDPLARPVSGDANRLQQIFGTCSPTPSSSRPRADGCRSSWNESTRTWRSASSTRAKASAQSSCRTFSTVSVRKMLPRAAAMAGWVWGWPSSRNWWNYTAARCAQKAAAPTRDRPSRWRCR